MKRLIPILLLAACAAPLAEEAPNPEEEAVRAAIQDVFDGMRTKDSAMVSARRGGVAALTRAVAPGCG